MSIPLMQRVLATSRYEGSTHTILLLLAFHFNDKTGLCYPGQQTLAHEARVNLRTVKRAIRTLLDDGVIAQTKRGCQSGGSSHYTFPDQSKGDKVSPFKGDICDSKGDICDSKGDICDSKGDICDSKGDALPPNRKKETNEREREKSEQMFSEGQGKAPFREPRVDISDLRMPDWDGTGGDPPLVLKSKFLRWFQSDEGCGVKLSDAEARKIVVELDYNTPLTRHNFADAQEWFLDHPETWRDLVVADDEVVPF